MNKTKTWKIISPILATVTVLLIGVVISLSRQAPVAADGQEHTLDATVVSQPQDIISIISSIRYDPADLLQGFVAVGLEYSADQDAGPHYVCRYAGPDDTWLETGIETRPDGSYVYQADGSMGDRAVSYFTGTDGTDGAVMAVYQVDGVSYFVRGNIARFDIDKIMKGYLEFLVMQNMI